MKEETLVADVYIESPKDCNLKYERCKTTGLLRCDRILLSPYTYPFNYGAFPNTLGGDGDELDAVVVTPYALFPHSLITCKIIGVLYTEDEKGRDEKIICVPADSVDIDFKDINDISNLSVAKRDIISYFFEHYKSREYNKFVKINGYGNADDARKIYQKALSAWRLVKHMGKK
jgi:inorganic pyrophosphatase